MESETACFPFSAEHPRPSLLTRFSPPRNRKVETLQSYKRSHELNALQSSDQRHSASTKENGDNRARREGRERRSYI